MTVFVPSSPTPFTGYTITVPRTDVIDLPISVEEAIRFAVTAGVLVPDHQVIETAVAETTGQGGEADQGPAALPKKAETATSTTETERRRDTG